ncbi:cell division initiation protein [Microbacterium sp. SLBN-146]|uniref:cell division initiation protein n=1 Tax=Microbacterium sp. SLBN-146 TaxID=2768457 RepID=UPI00114F7BB8|nr:cell division initiation protein [Microbacterium sp. SLBN-146]TQJ29798.1 hypothetical protein FBY39_0241 [Microbacterium sp. SLBN-146]
MSDSATPFEELLATAGSAAPGTAFALVFRGYDRVEVDNAFRHLTGKLRTQAQQIALLDEHLDRADDANAERAERIDRLEAELAAHRRRADEAERRAADLEKRVQSAVMATDAAEQIARLEAELSATQARLVDADNRLDALAEELATATDETPGRHRFDEVLRVAEEQASVLLRNASVQGERLLAAASEEILARRRETQADAEAILSQAQHDAQQIRLRIDTELTAHAARLERELAHAEEKIAQAEQEAAAIRSEAEKGAAALRSLVARETSQLRAEAEEAVRELRLRAIEFEESLTRRQDDARQEFLALHNQAVAHADRITQDANDQVAHSLEHAKRVSAKAEDFERLMRAQAHQIEADAQLRARERLDRAKDKAQSIIDTVVTHSQAVLRDAEDRTRQLRWQQQQLTSFMAEVRELIRPEPLADYSPETVSSSEDEDDEGAA